MNFGSLIGLANKNRIETESTKSKPKCFSTTVSPAVKTIRSSGPSPNVQAFLAKQEQEKREKEKEFKEKKEQLQSLRSQNSKNNKKAKIMASRTKDNDFSRIRLTEDELESKTKREVEIQRKMLTDKVERMKARINLQQEEALLPHKRKRKRKPEAGGPPETDYHEDFQSVGSHRQSHDLAPPVVKKKKPPPPSQPVSFQELMKVAAQKQQESGESEVSEYEDEVEEDRRPMTKKDLEKYREQEMRRKGISVNNRAPVKGKAAAKSRGPVMDSSTSNCKVNGNFSKNQTITSSTSNNKVNGNVRMGSQATQNSNKQYPQQNRSSDDRRTGTKKQNDNSNKQYPRGNRSFDEKKILPKGFLQDQQQRQVKSEDGVRRASSSFGPRDGDRRKTTVPTKNRNVDSGSAFKRPPAVPLRQPQESYRTTSDNSRMQSQGRQASRNSFPPRRDMGNEYDQPEEYVPQLLQHPRSVPKGYPQNRSKERTSNVDGQRSKGYPVESGQRSREQLSRQQNPAGLSKQPGRDVLRNSNNREPVFTNQKSKGHSEPSRKEMSYPGKHKTLSGNGQLSQRHSLPPRDSTRPPLPTKSGSRDLNRTVPQSAKPSPLKPQPQSKVPHRTPQPGMPPKGPPVREKVNQVPSKRFPPSPNNQHERFPNRFQDDQHVNRPKTKLPPIGHIRHKILGPRNPYGRLPSKIKKHYYESEEEDDDEMNDFIDDGNNEECNEDYSKHIRDIFGYDRSRYAFEDDNDDIVETTFAEQMKEEARSARIGLLEDMEDIRKEEEERKALLKQRKKLKN